MKKTIWLVLAVAVTALAGLAPANASLLETGCGGEFTKEDTCAFSFIGPEFNVTVTAPGGFVQVAIVDGLGNVFAQCRSFDHCSASSYDLPSLPNPGAPPIQPPTIGLVLFCRVIALGGSGTYACSSHLL